MMSHLFFPEHLIRTLCYALLCAAEASRSTSGWVASDYGRGFHHGRKLLAVAGLRLVLTDPKSRAVARHYCRAARTALLQTAKRKQS